MHHVSPTLAVVALLAAAAQAGFVADSVDVCLPDGPCEVRCRAAGTSRSPARPRATA